MPIKVLRETHDTPEYVSERLIRAGGLNRFGEPNYRCVWGWNRLTLIGGTWEQANSDGTPAEYAMRRVPKYPQVNRWHIERWVPSEAYGPIFDWKEKELGPFPFRGDYEHCMTLEDPQGQFIQLNTTVVEYIARAIEFSRRNKVRKSKLYDREARKDEEYVNWAMDRMDDNPTWLATPHSYLPAHLKEKLA